MLKVNTIASPADDRDFKPDDFLLQEVTPKKYLAPSTAVRCQWFSSQCVAFACTQAMSQQELIEYGVYNTYSPGLLYANRESTDYLGEGWYIRKALKQLKKYGTCLESEFPFPESYNTEYIKFQAEKTSLLEKASKHKISAYFRCTTEDEIKRCIVQAGGCIVSFSLYGKFYFRPTYTKQLADSNKPHGGHAVLLVGWTENNEWIAQDSYSILRPWGGKFKISFDFPISEYWGIVL